MSLRGALVFAEAISTDNKMGVVAIAPRNDDICIINARKPTPRRRIIPAETCLLSSAGKHANICLLMRASWKGSESQKMR